MLFVYNITTVGASQRHVLIYNGGSEKEDIINNGNTHLR